MVGNEMMENFFGPYNDSLKLWKDTIEGYTRTMKELSDTFGNIRNQSDEFKPFWENLFKWNPKDMNYTEMMEKMPLPYETMKRMTESLNKGIEAYREICNSCLKNAATISGETYAMELRTLLGQETAPERLIEALKDAYEDITENMSAALDDTPFRGVKEIHAAVKNALDAFSDEEQMMKEFLKEMQIFVSNISKLSASAAKEASEKALDINNETVSFETHKKMLDEYGTAHKKTMKLIGFPEALMPEYKKMIDDTIRLAGKHLDVLSSCMEMHLKSCRTIGKTTIDLCKMSGDGNGLKENKGFSQDEMYKLWTENYEKITQNLMEGTYFNGNVSKLINSCTDCIKSANTYYRNVMTLPYATKADLEKIKTVVQEAAPVGNA